MRILLRHLAVHYLVGCVPVLVALVSLFSFVTLVEELDQVGEGLYQTRDALEVTLLTTPARVLELLPVTLLLGGLLGLGHLARQREIVVMRAAGLSLAQLARPVLLVAAVAAASVVTMRVYIVPELELQAAHLRARTEATEIMRDLRDSGYWMRTGDQLLYIDRLVDGQVLDGIEIYYLGESGRVERMIRARRGDIVGPREWLLHGVTEFDFRSARMEEESHQQLAWQSPLSGQQTASLVVPLKALSPPALYRYIRLLDRSGLESHRHKLVFWQQISQLVALFIMALLCLPFVLGVQRGGALGRSVLLGGVIGLGFFLAEQIMGHLSALLNLAPAFAALLPEALMLLLTFRLLRAANAH